MKNRLHIVVCAAGLGMLGCTMNIESTDALADETSGDAVAGLVPFKMAMTWTLLASAQPNASEAYVLVGSDARTNPYGGDTYTTSHLPVLCISKSGLPHPGAVIGGTDRTPGGASRRSWSGGTVALTPPVPGTALTSQAAADALCARHFGPRYRMAEFHDGDPTLWSGWDFWAAARGADLRPFWGTRFWVSINDQNANPW